MFYVLFIPYIIRLRANTSYDTSLSCSRDSSISFLFFNFFSPAFHVFDLGTNNLDTPWPTLGILLTAYSIVLQHLPLSYGPTCSKLFIGGLNWDTTDGILPLHHVVVCSANGHSLVLLSIFRRPEGLLFPVWKGTAFTSHTRKRETAPSHCSYLKVDACTIMRDASGTSRGFAFLTFEDANAVNAVVAREHVLDGKTVRRSRR